MPNQDVFQITRNKVTLQQKTAEIVVKFEFLLWEYYPYIHRLALSILNDVHEPDDVAQDTFRYDVRFIHAWGQIQGSSTDGIALNLAGWENSSLIEEYITGTLQTQNGQMQLVSLDRTLTLVNPPVDIPNGTQVGIQGVILEGKPPVVNWKFIETGQIPFSYGASNTCGGSGSGGGGNTLNADFGGGGFASLNLDSQPAPIATQVADPYQPGDQINAFAGTVSITRHLYLDGKSSDELYLYPEPPRDLATGWGYSLIGENLSGIDQYKTYLFAFGVRLTTWKMG